MSYYDELTEKHRAKLKLNPWKGLFQSACYEVDALRQQLAASEQARAEPFGANLIAIERARQQSVEKYGSWHDDEHRDGSLRVVAAKLCCIGTDAHVEDALDRSMWNLERHPQIKRLVIAGALIAAEIDRIQRIATHARQPDPSAAPASAQPERREGGA